MKKIILSRRAVHFDAKISSYKLALEVTSSEGIIKEVFVKQRLRNPMTNTFNDVFAAIASPTQLEDLDRNSPSADTTYFLVSKVDLVGASAEYLDEVFNSIVADIQRLVTDCEIVENLSPDGIYTIQSDTIDVDMGTPHTHYRLPLIAAPCGLNELFIDTDSLQKHRVGSQDTTLPGWVNSTYLTYKFKYNVATDTTLNALWPVDTDKLQYAHVEVNGITDSSILLDATGIYWKSNLLGEAPWPQDYLNSGSPGSTPLVLVIDFIK